MPPNRDNKEAKEPYEVNDEDEDQYSDFWEDEKNRKPKGKKIRKMRLKSDM